MPSAARTCALALVAAGCFVDEGLPDGSESATSAATTTTSTSSATEPPTTTPTTGPGSATAPAGCGGFGEPCGEGCCGCLACTFGFCIASPTGCDACERCRNDGECVLDPGAACTALDDPCPATIWGLEDESCYAYAPAQGQCDADGACVAEPCTDQGDAFASCADVECTDPSTCVQGMPVDSAANFCVKGGSTPACGITCTDIPLVESIVSIRMCDQSGACVETDTNACGNYKCADAKSCRTSCTLDDECALNGLCAENMCVPPP